MMIMNKLLRLTVWGISTVIFYACFTNFASAQPGGNEVVIGKSYQIDSKIFNEKRTIFVSLPDNYKNSDDKYPVLYLLDGYDHFRYVSGMVISLSRSRQMPQMIVVGIQNLHRNKDFTPRSIIDLPDSGGADKFLQFAEEELFTFIDNNFRTEHCRILLGHSQGGMFAIYALLTNPGLFNGFIAVSPAVWSDDKYIFEYAKQKLDEEIELNNFLYFTIGGNELPENIDAVEQLESIITHFSPEELEWKFQLIKNEGHFSVIPSSIYDGLNYFNSLLTGPEKIQNGSLDEILTYFERLTIIFNYEIKPPEDLLNKVGYRFLNDGNSYDAIDTFIKSIELYPNSANALNSLGEAYETNNQLNLAFEFYQKAYELASKTRDPNLIFFIQDYENIEKKIKGRR